MKRLPILLAVALLSVRWAWTLQRPSDNEIKTIDALLAETNGISDEIAEKSKQLEKNRGAWSPEVVRLAEETIAALLQQRRLLRARAVQDTVAAYGIVIPLFAKIR